MNKKNNLFICFFSILILLQYFNAIDCYALFSISKDVSDTVTVPEPNFCLSNGFTKLSDCMLVMENYSTSVSAAKKHIEGKGKATYTEIAPKNIYAEKSEFVDAGDTGVIITTTKHYTLGTSYRFDSETGKYFIGDYDSSGNFVSASINDVLSDKYINYYTCGSTEGVYDECAIMYQIKDYFVEKIDNNVHYRVNRAVKYIYNAVNSFDSEVGLYSDSDDYGTTYFYRGNVSNNYVSFAGYIWKIIRRNGDGSIRMIYNGTSPDSTVSQTSIVLGPYNSNPSDPAYVGYMYNKNFAQSNNKNDTITFVRFSENSTYYFGSGYAFDNSTKKFYLTGSTKAGVFGNIYSTVISSYPYTCFGASSTDQCDFIVNILEYVDKAKMKVKVTSYSSTNAESAREPKISSTIKETVDNWYASNILNKKDSNSNSFSSYLSDTIFCNDRTLVNGDGITLTRNSNYRGNYTISDGSVSFKCSQATDKFTVNTTNGNGALTYPVGLITLDEAMAAGGVNSQTNSSYYLYTNQNYWTMTPTYFGYTYIYGRIASIGYSGELQKSKALSNSYGVRPVVNLKSSVVITSGDGSAEKPYVVSLG